MIVTPVSIVRGSAARPMILSLFQCDDLLAVFDSDALTHQCMYYIICTLCGVSISFMR